MGWDAREHAAWWLLVHSDVGVKEGVGRQGAFASWW